VIEWGYKMEFHTKHLIGFDPQNKKHLTTLLDFYRSHKLYVDEDERVYVNQMMVSVNNIPDINYHIPKTIGTKSIPSIEPKKTTEPIPNTEPIPVTKLIKVSNSKNMSYDDLIETLKPTVFREGILKDLEGFTKAMKEDDIKIKQGIPLEEPKSLEKQFEQENEGKHAIWRNTKTKAYINWLKEKNYD